MIKKQLATQPFLELPSFAKLFTLKCGLSSIGVGGVLSQEGRLVAFFSEKINEAKNKYSSYDLGLYTLVQSIKK